MHEETKTPKGRNEERMKKIIAKNRTEAVKFANGGKIHAQRAAYWKSKGVAYRAERCPGEHECRIAEDVANLWWSATKTIAQKLGI